MSAEMVFCFSGRRLVNRYMDQMEEGSKDVGIGYSRLLLRYIERDSLDIVIVIFKKYINI